MQPGIACIAFYNLAIGVETKGVIVLVLVRVVKADCVYSDHLWWNVENCVVPDLESDLRGEPGEEVE